MDILHSHAHKNKSKTTQTTKKTTNIMRTKLLIFLLPLLAAGCREKETACENYQHYAPTEAVEAWNKYTAGKLHEWDAYNSVSTTLAYLGPRFYAYDSIVAKHDRDTVLLCGYFKKQGDVDGLYMMVDDPLAAIDGENILQGTAHSPDTTRKAFVRAVLVASATSRFLESYPSSNVSPCPAYNYFFDFDYVVTYKD